MEGRRLCADSVVSGHANPAFLLKKQELDRMVGNYVLDSIPFSLIAT